MQTQKSQPGAGAGNLSDISLPKLNPDYSKRPSTKELAFDQWELIYSHFLPDTSPTHTKHQPCPVCGGKDRFRCFPDWQQTGGAICNKCGGGQGITWVMRVLGCDFPSACRYVEGVLGIRPEDHTQIDWAAREEARRKRKAAEKAKQERDAKRNYARTRRILDKSVSLESFEPGLNYLRRRGLGGLIESGDLPVNWFGHSDLRYDKTGSFPALVAPVMLYDQPVSVHRTYITPEGSKAPVDSPKKLTSAVIPGLTRGAAIRLYRPSHELAVTEGIETALAVRLALPELPVWACISANGLQNFIPPDGMKRVYIAGDNDTSGTGQKAAEHLKTRLEARGIEALVLLPSTPGTDWLDVVAQEVAA